MKHATPTTAQSPLFYIEGNTGSGKTTLLRAIAKKHPEFVTLEEPLDDIQNVDGINALEVMYEDLKRWSFTVNLLYYEAHIAHLKKTMKAHSGQVIVSDRSLYTGLAFMQADYQAGAIHLLEKILYERLVKFASSSVQKPDGFIYIRTQPETNFARIQKRNRQEEAHISADYWKLLHKGHERMFHADNPFLKNIPVLVIDYDGDIDENPQCVDTAVEQIENFICEVIRNKTIDYEAPSKKLSDEELFHCLDKEEVERI